MTIKQTLAEIRVMGLTANRTEHGEYRINFRGSDDRTAHYTEDADDAVNTAKYMSTFEANKLHSVRS